MKNVLLAALATLTLCGCMPSYGLVKPGTVAVGNQAMTVTPGMAWNRIPRGSRQLEWEEAWTQNGPLLDSIGFVSGMPDGKSLVRQRRKADAQVAVFRADMSPTDLVSMIESVYRVGGITVFAVDSVDPAPFLGGMGLRMNFHFAPGDGMRRRGAAVLRVVDGKLYLIKLEGVTSHYFAASEPEFERLVTSAALKK
jgi:hypothetical protein